MISLFISKAAQIILHKITHLHIYLDLTHLSGFYIMKFYIMIFFYLMDFRLWKTSF